MATKETAAQKRARINALLADYDSRNHELNKLTSIVKGLKTQIRDIEPGTYGDLTLTFGAGREMFDQAEAKRLLTDHKLDIPVFTTQGVIVITSKAAR
jgi:hypothetical protein